MRALEGFGSCHNQTELALLCTCCHGLPGAAYLGSCASSRPNYSIAQHVVWVHGFRAGYGMAEPLSERYCLRQTDSALRGLGRVLSQVERHVREEAAALNQLGDQTMLLAFGIPFARWGTETTMKQTKCRSAQPHPRTFQVCRTSFLTFRIVQVELTGRLQPKRPCHQCTKPGSRRVNSPCLAGIP